MRSPTLVVEQPFAIGEMTFEHPDLGNQLPTHTCTENPDPMRHKPPSFITSLPLIMFSQAWDALDGHFSSKTVEFGKNLALNTL